jgi:hypothetical protein
MSFFLFSFFLQSKSILTPQTGIRGTLEISGTNYSGGGFEAALMTADVNDR